MKRFIYNAAMMPLILVFAAALAAAGFMAWLGALGTVGTAGTEKKI